MDTISTHFRLDKNIKEEAFSVLQEIGLKPAQAVNLFLKQVALQKAIPFELKAYAPNDETIEAMNSPTTQVGSLDEMWELAEKS